MLPIQEYYPLLQALCKKYQVTRLEVFGSAARNAHTTKSDIDFLVVFDPDLTDGYADNYYALKTGLEGLFKRRVDLVELEGVKNHVFLRAIETDRMLVYAA
jgi:predicted nucleotidyltransferase